MEVNEIDTAKLNEALDNFGSLQKAIEHLEQDKVVLEKQNCKLAQENEKLAATRNGLAGQIKDMSGKVKSYQDQLQSLFNQINVHSRQYELFCGFMAMVAESPSVTDSIDALIASFQKLKEPGWYLPKNADEMRSLFVRSVMGDYLKSFSCDACGCKFISNRMPKRLLLGTSYWCPSCNSWSGAKEDDSLLKAMVSEKQLENTRRLEDVQKENEALAPFKAFLNAPCDICHEPVKEWDDWNVKVAVEGIGCGHTGCWNSSAGQIRQLQKVVELVGKERKT